MRETCILLYDFSENRIVVLRKPHREALAVIAKAKKDFDRALVEIYMQSISSMFLSYHSFADGLFIELMIVQGKLTKMAKAERIKKSKVAIVYGSFSGNRLMYLIVLCKRKAMATPCKEIRAMLMYRSIWKEVAIRL